MKLRLIRAPTLSVLSHDPPRRLDKGDGLLR